MTIFFGPFVILDRMLHARLITDVVKARAALADMQARALEAERLHREARAAVSHLHARACVQHEVIAQLQAAVRDADVLLGLNND